MVKDVGLTIGGGIDEVSPGLLELVLSLLSFFVKTGPQFDLAKGRRDLPSQPTASHTLVRSPDWTRFTTVQKVASQDCT
jgi:hypothetical protein